MLSLRFFIRQRRGSLRKPFPPSCRDHMAHAHDLAAEQTSQLCHVCLKKKKTPPPVFIHNSHFLYSTFSTVGMETGCLVAVVVPF